MVGATSTSTDYQFTMDEDFKLCNQTLIKKRKAQDVPALCNTPFYSFMIALSEQCHEAIMSVLTVQMFVKEDKVGCRLLGEGQG